MKFAIDLLWVNHNKIGGVESYVRNLLDGFLTSDEQYQIYLITSIDNYDSFAHYGNDPRLQVIKCNSKSTTISSITWINLHLDKLISSLGVDFCFVPNSRMPFITSAKNRYVCTIHDLQALHFPEYFTKLRVWYLKKNWTNLVKSSYRLIVISEFVKSDVLKRFGISESKLKVIYNPISSLQDIGDFGAISKKFGIEKDNYFYTVSSLLQHKNTLTLLKMMDKLVNEKQVLSKKLLISGIKGDHFNYLADYVKEHGLIDYCIFTGFVSDAERNSLMKNAEFFLFPSIFEGFGMPVVEALRLGTKVITTRCTSIEEVSKGKAFYVDNPFDVEELINMINTNQSVVQSQVPFKEYDVTEISRQYLDYFKSIS